MNSVTAWLLVTYIGGRLLAVVPDVATREECVRLAHVMDDGGHNPGYEGFYNCIEYQTRIK